MTPPCLKTDHDRTVRPFVQQENPSTAEDVPLQRRSAYRPQLWSNADRIIPTGSNPVESYLGRVSFMSPVSSGAEPQLALNNGVVVNQLGFGVYKVPPSDTAELCGEAIRCGYRHIDTATLYDNEAGVGQAVRESMSEGRFQRRDLFVTTKVWNESHGFERTLRAFEESQKRLGLEVVDLYLIHWPCPQKKLFVETYKALERLYADGLVRAIGVSNFNQVHLEKLLQETSIVPTVNQIELHPWLQQTDLQEYHNQVGIRTEAWSPLGRGSVLRDPEIQRLAVELEKTPAQIILRWHIQRGVIAIPKSSSPQRMANNMDIFDFTLDAKHMAQIAALDRGQRSGSNPEEVN